MDFNENDYKYVIQDYNTVYIGARMSFHEMLMDEEVPFKFRAAIDQFLLKDANRESTLAQYLFVCKETDSSYLVLKQLHVKIKVTMKRELLDRKKREGYGSKVFELDEFIHSELIHTYAEEILIEEIQFSKLRMLGI